jgi:hypothetical protein
MDEATWRSVLGRKLSCTVIGINRVTHHVMQTSSVPVPDSVARALGLSPASIFTPADLLAPRMPCYEPNVSRRVSLSPGRLRRRLGQPVHEPALDWQTCFR